MSDETFNRVRHGFRAWRHRPRLGISRDPADVGSMTIRYLMYVLMPAWFIPGIADHGLPPRRRLR